LEPGLLTERIAIEAACPPTLTIRSLHWGALTLSQCALLNVHSAMCFVREITLSSGQRHWIFAQTLVPESKHALLAWLLALANRSLGEALTQCRNVRQGPFEYRRLPPEDPLVQRAMQTQSIGPRSLWARRRWIAIGAQRFLLQEIFLLA
jgi:chorismate-pyruvate lyase